MHKQQLRKLMISKQLSSEEKRTKSEVICTTLRTLPEFQDAKTIGFYVSTPDEVHTHDIIKEVLHKKEKRIAVPLYSAKMLSELSHWSDLAMGAFGILEPRTVSAIDVDLVIVPGVAFDIQGNRLGRGKGFYDKLLQHFQGHVIGLAFEQQIVKEIPTENHDIKIQKLITETRIITNGTNN